MEGEIKPEHLSGSRSQDGADADPSDRSAFSEAELHDPPARGQPTRRVFLLSLQAIFNAIVIGFIAKGMLYAIDLVTNIAFHGTFSFAAAAPTLEHVGAWVLVIPIIGALLVGVMARYGSKNIRGHGFPETIEKILAKESRIQPKVTILKPLSAAVSIGTGGPFGAEGPIIATGGAFGSLSGQMMRVTANERKIMLVAGSCAGVAAIFGSPVAGILMAIELLLFEYSPRSIIPVALACTTAAAMHYILFGQEPIFEMPDIPEPASLALLVYVGMGFILGVGGALASKAVYAVEDFFAAKLGHVHWMWWPAIGAVVVGIIGYVAPRTMGVGYDNIVLLLSGNVTLNVILALSFLKFISWAVYLGSGTSGSTMAPLFTIGGGLGALLGYITLHLFPDSGINMATCALIGMAATFTGATRAYLTAIVFAFETTGQAHGLLPLIGACTAAYLISFFMMKGGSLYTEKLERMGIHTPFALEADILQKLLVQDVLEENASVLSAGNTIADARRWIKTNAADEGATDFVVVDKGKQLVGLVKRRDIFGKQFNDNDSIRSITSKGMVFLFPGNELSFAIDMMDIHSSSVIPVIRRGGDRKVVGVLTHKAIFSAYRRRRKEEEIYETDISLKRQGIKIIHQGRQLLRWDRD